MITAPVSVPDRPVEQASYERLRTVMTRDGGPVMRLFPYVAEPMLVRRSDRSVWVFADVEHDPLAAAGFPLPRGPRRDLRRVLDAGIDFDALVLAHELDPGRLTPEEAAVTADDGPLRCRPGRASHLVGPVPPYPGAVRLARRLERVARMTRAASPVRAVRALDPVVFGVWGAGSELSAGSPVRYVALTAWAW
jgi:hypothetical protein